MCHVNILALIHLRVLLLNKYEISSIYEYPVSYGKIMLIILFMRYEYSWHRGTTWHLLTSWR